MLGLPPTFFFPTKALPAHYFRVWHQACLISVKINGLSRAAFEIGRSMGQLVSKHLYEDHFGLLEFPFSITPDPRFSYDNPLYREAFAKLRYGIEARKGFIVITGEVGTGKTTLLKAFMQSVESTIHTAFILNPKLNFNQLVRSILTDLGIACSSQEQFMLMAKLNDYLIEQFKKDHIVAVFIDEAQDLSDELLEEIRLLSNLETDKSRLLQIVLIGQPEFEQRLDQPELQQLKQRIALRGRLTPLPSSEVGPYINHRLKTAGYQGKELFETKAVERISLHSQGIPRLINVICDNALLIAYASSTRKVSVEMIEEVARDLKLTVSSRTQRNGSVVATPRRRDEIEREIGGDKPTVEATHYPEFDNVFMEVAPNFSQKSRAYAAGIGIFLGLILLTGIGGALYSPQSKDFVSAMAVRLEDVSEHSGNYVLDIAVIAERQGKKYLSDAAMKAADYSERSRNYFSALAEEMKEHSPHFQKVSGAVSDGMDYLSRLATNAKDSVATHWENLTQVNFKTSGDNSANTRFADSPGLNPNFHPVPAAEDTSDSEKIAEARAPEIPAALADGPAATSETSDPPKTQVVEPQIEGLKNEPSQLNSQTTPKKEEPAFLGNFEVVQDSFLRDKPASDAAITTLPPGTRVRVESKNGDYLRVRSLSDPALRGYVHREDAFFERIR
jgi:general secretion pathway protein A